MTTYTAADMVLCRSDAGDGGWSLHAPGATDEEIAVGDAPIILDGEAELIGDQWTAPTEADYAEGFRLWQIGR